MGTTKVILRSSYCTAMRPPMEPKVSVIVREISVLAATLWIAALLPFGTATSVVEATSVAVVAVEAHRPPFLVAGDWVVSIWLDVGDVSVMHPIRASSRATARQRLSLAGLINFTVSLL
jgi:hypothetical protein